MHTTTPASLCCPCSCLTTLIILEIATLLRQLQSFPSIQRLTEPQMAGEFPDIGHFDLRSMHFDGGTFEIELHDYDTRRTVMVAVPNPNGMLPSDDDPEGYIPLKKAADFLDQHMDDLPAEAVAIKLDAGGNMLSVSTDSRRDDGPGADAFLLRDYQLPPDVAPRTILRSELTEIRRLHGQVDLVSYPGDSTQQDNRYVFKYSIGRALSLWKEVQMLARLPHDPQLAWLDRVVLDEISRSRVVGFTMRFVDNASLLTQNTHFKIEVAKAADPRCRYPQP